MDLDKYKGTTITTELGNDDETIDAITQAGYKSFICSLNENIPAGEYFFTTPREEEFFKGIILAKNPKDGKKWVLYLLSGTLVSTPYIYGSCVDVDFGLDWPSPQFYITADIYRTVARYSRYKVIIDEKNRLSSFKLYTGEEGLYIINEITSSTIKVDAELKKIEPNSVSIPQNKDSLIVSKSSDIVSTFKPKPKEVVSNDSSGKLLGDQVIPYLFEIIVKNVDKGKKGVYIIYNHTTNEFYVGSSVNMLRRKNQHLKQLRENIHKTYSLQNAYNQYGENNFSFYALALYEYEETLYDIRTKTLVLSLEQQNREYHKDKLRQRNRLLELEQKFIDRYKPKYNTFANVYDFRQKYGRSW